MSDWPLTHSQACFDVISRRCVCALGNREARIKRLACEMEALLREEQAFREGDTSRWQCWNRFTPTCTFPAPDGRDCYEHRRRALIARIDAPLKEGL